MISWLVYYCLKRSLVAMRSISVFSVTIGALLATLQPVLAQGARGNAEEGRLYAVNRCTLCHSVEPETDRKGTYAPNFTAIAKRRTTSARALKAYIQSDHVLMPNFMLNSKDADDIVAYILSLRRK